jgi:hypothetical protein
MAYLQNLLSRKPFGAGEIIRLEQARPQRAKNINMNMVRVIQLKQQTCTNDYNEHDQSLATVILVLLLPGPSIPLITGGGLFSPGVGPGSLLLLSLISLARSAA